MRTISLLAIVCFVGCVNNAAPQEGAHKANNGQVKNGAAKPQHFLVRDGAGDEDEAETYDESLDLEVATLDDFKTKIIGSEFVDAFYRNTADLGFWREMRCSTVVDRGVGGCAVRNWSTPEQDAHGASNLGTVAMRLDGGGRVQFLAFTPDGKRSPFVILDDEGKKFLPMACTVCHGGDAHVGDRSGLGSIFREFEPSLLATPPGASTSDLDASLFSLNQIVALANTRVKTEAEGAPFGSDHARDGLDSYLDEMYDAQGVAADVHSDVHVPPSWRADDAAEDQLRVNLWTKVVNPYCMQCHRTSPSYDFRDYALFETLRATKDGVSGLRHELDVTVNPIVMPQSELLANDLAGDADAQAAIDAWIAGAPNTPPIASVSPSTARGAAGDVVTFDASSSFDADGDAITFAWTQTSGPAAPFVSGSDTSTIAVTVPDAPDATLVFDVRITDARGAFSDAQVELLVDAGAQNQLPVAVLDAPASANAGDIVTASSTSSSDPDGDALTVSWTAGNALVFPSSDATTVNVLVAPTSSFDLFLNVSDGRGGSDSAAAHVQVSTPAGTTVVVDDPQLAIPDADANGIATTLALDVPSDATITSLTVPVLIQHTFAGDLRVVVTGPSGFQAVLQDHVGGSVDNIVQSFSVPSAVGQLASGTWTLQVVDDAAIDTGTLVSWGLVATTQQPAPNQAPVVSVAPVASPIAPGATITLDASASFDPDADPLTFSWTQTSGTPIALTNISSNGSIVIATPTIADTYEFNVNVSDDHGHVETDFVVVDVEAAPPPPPPPPPPTGKMQIAEIFVNPSGIDSGLEWIRIKNDTGADVDLAHFAVAFGGNTTWGNTAGGNGGVLSMSGALPAGACKLVVAGQSTATNATPDLSNAIVVTFPGNGLQNPSTVADAVAIFDVSSGPVSSTSRPLDVIAYGATSAPSPSGFVGPDGNAAPVDVHVTDGAQGKSLRRTSTGAVVESGAVGAADGPTPNACP